jgi:DNA (cytosine-5)-methyltransferase 1
MIIKVASLFSGCGGLDYGFEKTPSFELVFANDFNHHACETYRKNFKNAQEYLKEGDVKTYIDAIPKHNLLLGGFPCQAFSLAGKRLGFDDERGLYYLACKKVLEKNKPELFIFENVGGIKSHNKGETLNIIIDAFREVGYKVITNEFLMSDFGVPQQRKRLLFFGVNNKFKLSPQKLIPKIQGTNKKELLLKNVLKRFPKLDKAYGILDKLNHNYHIGKKDVKFHWIKILNEGENLSKLSIEEVYRREDALGLNHKKIPKTMMGYRRLNGEKISPTMMFGNTCLPIHPYEDRDLSVREVAAIQGFPDDFIFMGGISHQYRQLGNAVPPIFSSILAKHIANIFIKKEKV